MHTPDGILMYPVAHIRSDFPTKFGIPKQSGLSQALEARVVFCPEYRSADAVRGLEEFSHIWLLWQFSAAVREGETFSRRGSAATSASACLRAAAPSARTTSVSPA